MTQITNDAREIILKQYDKLIYMYAHRLTNSPSLVDDLAQEGKLGLLRGIDRYGTVSMNYVHGSIANGMKDYIRSTTHRGRAIKPLTLEWCNAPADDNSEQIDDNLIIRDAMQVLTDRQWQIINAALKGLRHYQIALLFGISQASVKQSYDSAVKKMRNKIV